MTGGWGFTPCARRPNSFFSDASMSEPKPSPAPNRETDALNLPALSRFGSPQQARLRASLLDAQRRISALPEGTDARVLQRCRDCLQRAAAGAARDSYVAWDCLHQLEDELLATLSEDERRARFVSMRAEASEKLRASWREQAVERLVKLVPEDQAPPLHLLRELHSHLAAASQNKHHQLDQFERRSLPWLTVLLSLSLLAVVAYSAWILLHAPAGGEDEVGGHRHQFYIARPAGDREIPNRRSVGRRAQLDIAADHIELRSGAQILLAPGQRERGGAKGCTDQSAAYEGLHRSGTPEMRQFSSSR